MRKHALKWLLCLSLVLAMMPAAMAAAEDAPCKEGNVTHTAGECLNDLTFSAGTTVELASKTYYLSEDLIIEDDGTAKGSNAYIKVPTGVTATVCLNGCALDSSYKYTDTDHTQLLFQVFGTLNICDCVGTGSITHNSDNDYRASTFRLDDAGAVLNLYGGNITGNTNVRYGAVYVWKGTFNMYGGKVTNNKAVDFENGAGVYTGSTGVFNMAGGEISGNEAAGAGGGYYNAKGKATISGGTIKGNTAVSEGGGISYTSASTSFKMTGGTITENHVTGTSTSGGGGLFFNGSSNTATISGGTISNNTSSGHGGGIFCAGTTTLTVTGGTISGNTAEANGGGIYVKTGACRVKTGAVISGNTAENGGGIYLLRDTQITTASTKIEGNTATNNGGGIYVAAASSNKFYIEKASVSGNWANRGGGIYVTGTITSAKVETDTVIEDNVAETNGGGIYLAEDVSTSTLLLDSGTVSGNIAGGSGAGLYNLASGATVKMSGITIQGNKTQTVTLPEEDGEEITYTNVTVPGGQVYNQGTIVMSDGKIFNNTCKGNGGSVLNAAGGVFTLNGGTIDSGANSGSTGRSVLNQSLFIMNGGTIDAPGATNAISGYGYIDADTQEPVNSTTLIFGGTVTQKVSASAAEGATATVKIYGGSIDAINTANSRGEFELYGGTYGADYSETLNKTSQVALNQLENGVFVPMGDGTYKLMTDKWTGSNMKVYEKLDMNLYFTTDAATYGDYTYELGSDNTTVTATWVSYEAPTTATIIYKDGTTETVTPTTTADGYTVTVSGVSAKEMADDVIVLLGDGTDVHAGKADSVKEYGERMLEDPSKSDVHTLIVDMLNYGAAAQVHLAKVGEEVGTLANAGIDAYQALATDVTDEFAAAYANWGNVTYADTRAYHSANLTLENDVDFNLYFWVGQIGDNKTFTCKVNGVEQEPGTFSEMLDGELLYKVKIPDLTVAQLADAEVEITFSDLDGTKTITDSVYNYLVRNEGYGKWSKEGTDESGLSKALMAFATSAAAYNA